MELIQFKNLMKTTFLPILIAFLFAINFGCYFTRQSHNSVPIRNGKSEVFYDSRVKKQEGNYKNGKRDGLFTQWDTAGKKTKDEIYIKDKLNGPQNFYDENGNIIKTTQWKNDKIISLDKKSNK